MKGICEVFLGGFSFGGFVLGMVWLVGEIIGGGREIWIQGFYLLIVW